MAETEPGWDDHFFGAVTVGERGQVVIPAEARKRFDISPGDKLLIMSDPGGKALMLCKFSSLKTFMTRFQEGLARVEKDLAGDVPASDSAAAEEEPRS